MKEYEYSSNLSKVIEKLRIVNKKQERREIKRLLKKPINGRKKLI